MTNEFSLLERRISDRRTVAKQIAMRGILINLVMLLLGVCVGYYLAAEAISRAVIDGLK